MAGNIVNPYLKKRPVSTDALLRKPGLPPKPGTQPLQKPAVPPAAATPNIAPPPPVDFRKQMLANAMGGQGTAEVNGQQVSLDQMAGQIAGPVVAEKPVVPPVATPNEIPPYEIGENFNPGKDIQEGPGNFFNQAKAIMEKIPGVSEFLEGKQDPSRFLQSASPEALAQLNDLFASGAYTPGANPYMDQLNEVLKTGTTQAPTITSAPTTYDQKSAPDQVKPEYDTSDLNLDKFDPKSVQGPKDTGVTNIDDISFDPTSTSLPGLEELIKMALGNGATPEQANVLREKLQSSNYADDPTFKGKEGLSDKALQAALEDAMSLSKTGMSDELRRAFDEEYARAGAVGRSNAGRQGFTAGGTVAGNKIGQEVGSAATRNLPALMEAISGNRRAGLGALQNIGQTAGGLATDRGRMRIDETSDQNRLNVEQRSQDIQMLAERLRDGNLSEEQRAKTVTDLARLVQEGELGAQEIGIKKGGTIGDLKVETDKVKQAGEQGNYDAQTRRIAAEANIASGQTEQKIAAYRAATDRGDVNQRAQAAYDNLGLDYEKLNVDLAALGADNQNKFNQAAIELFDTEGNLNEQHFQTIVSSLAEMANLTQEGQIEAGKQKIDSARIAADILKGGADAELAWDQLFANARQEDRAALIQLFEFRNQIEVEREQGRKNRRANIAGDIIGAVGDIAGAGIPLLGGSKGGG